MRTFILLSLMLVLLFSGCTFFGPKEQQNLSDVPEPPPITSSVKPPNFSILSPKQNEALTGGVSLGLSVQNINLRSPGGSHKAGEGHFRVTLDNSKVFIVTNRVFEIPSIEPGTHTLKVELLKNDGSSYDLIKTVSFSVNSASSLGYTPSTYNVKIVDGGFEPSSLTIKAGDSITFTNTLPSPQSALSLKDGNEVFNTKILSKDQSKTVTISQIGEFEFYSVIRPQLKSKLTVMSNGSIN